MKRKVNKCLVCESEINDNKIYCSAKCQQLQKKIDELYKLLQKTHKYKGDNSIQRQWIKDKINQIRLAARKG